MKKKDINDKDTLSNLERPNDEKPSVEWSLKQLGHYARLQDDECNLLRRKLAIHRFREGWALSIAREKVMKEHGYGHWAKFLKEHGISTTSDNRARELYRKAEREENVENLTIMEAYEEFGIEPKPKAAARRSPAPVEPSGDPVPEGPGNEEGNSTSQEVSIAPMPVENGEPIGKPEVPLEEQLALAKAELEKATQRRAEAMAATEQHDGEEGFSQLYKVYAAAKADEEKCERQVKMLEARQKRQRTIEDDSKSLREFLADIDEMLETALIILNRIPREDRDADLFDEYVSSIWGQADGLITALRQEGVTG